MSCVALCQLDFKPGKVQERGRDKDCVRETDRQTAAAMLIFLTLFIQMAC